jgi:hypothetical protein
MFYDQSHQETAISEDKMTQTELNWSGIKFMAVWIVAGIIGWVLSDEIKSLYYKITAY